MFCSLLVSRLHCYVFISLTPPTFPMHLLLFNYMTLIFG